MARKELDDYSLHLIGAVKAELARRDLSGLALVPVLGLNRNAVYARLRGEQPFDVAELSKIADFLDMTVGEINESAAFGKRAIEKAAA